MKYFYVGTIVLYLLVICSCKQNKEELVHDFIRSSNNFEKEKLEMLLTEDFIYYGTSVTLDKTEYLNRIDSLKKVESKLSILNIIENEAFIKTEERVTSALDSLLEIKPEIILKKTYYFNEGKINKITIDSIINWEEYAQSFVKEYSNFMDYMRFNHEIIDNEIIWSNILKYLTEYHILPQSDKKRFKTISNLQGTFVSKNSIYAKLIFRGKSTVTVVDAFLGFPFATSYDIDEQYLRIKADNTFLLFEIIDDRTLIGEGFATGTFYKTK